MDSNAAGGLWSTPNDMAKYLEFQLNLGKIGEKQIVPEAVMKWLRHGSNPVPRNSFKSSEDEIVLNLLSYGLGLMTASYDGWEYLQHSGYYASYGSLMSLFPSQKLGIFTSSNQAPVMLDQMILHSFIFETLERSENVEERITRLIDRKSTEYAEKISTQTKVTKNFLGGLGEHKKTNRNFSEITGSYGSGSSGDIEIFEKFNPDTNSTGLYLSYGKWAHAWLEIYDNDDKSDETAEVINLKVIWDTDIIQDNYAAGDPTGLNYGRIYNQTLEFIGPGAEQVIVYGTFKLGVSLDKLPPIPWSPGSCKTMTA